MDKILPFSSIELPTQDRTTRNSFKKNVDDTPLTAVTGEEAVISSFVKLADIHARNVLVDNTMNSFETVARLAHDPDVYANKDDISLFNFWVYDPYQGFEVTECARNRRPQYLDHLVVDYDAAGPDMLDVSNRFKKFRHVLYSTANNVDGKKFRLVLELEASISVDILAHPDNKKKLIDFFDGCDPTSFDINRFFFIPAVVSRKTEYNVVVWLHGESFKGVEEIGLTKYDGFTYEHRNNLPTGVRTLLEEEAEDEGIAINKGRTFVARTAHTYNYLEKGYELLEELAPVAGERGGLHDVHRNLFKIVQSFVDGGMDEQDAKEVLVEELERFWSGSDMSNLRGEIKRINVSV